MTMMVPYPDDIRPLTSLRFFAAWVVVCYHLIYFIDVFYPAAVVKGIPMHPGILPFLQKGYLAVDFFFILSGFILVHVYGAALAAGRVGLREFYGRRLARLYPLHFLTLVFFGALYVLRWVPAPSPDTWLAHLFMVQSWGPNPLWPRALNGPSWSISAEWLAYLCFPVVLAFMKGRRPRYNLVVAVIVMVIVSCAGRMIFGHYSSDQITWCFFRVLPEFAFGAALYQFCAVRVPLPEPGLILAILAVFLFGAVNTALPDPIMLLVFGGVIVAAGDLSRVGGKDNFLQKQRWVYLGDISYAVYMLHYPMMVIIFGGALKISGLETFGTIFPLLAALCSVALITLSALAHQCVEKPFRRWAGRRLMPERPQ
ncbi:MAG: acyltransferase 3 [Micavibrio sp.]|nr:acyltransferase 3 [Micavibrio sp.]